MNKYEITAGGFVELLISIAIGAVITLMLTIACVSMVKWAQQTMISIEQAQEKEVDLYEIYINNNIN